MSRKTSKFNNFFNALFFFAGFSLGTLLIWPGLLKSDSRNCFLNIVKDGSDGSVTLGTILSIDPNSLIKIKNATNTYSKILRIGDFCFRK
tara:strand:+ start:34 stop:303 length:270 start_codon:yes stop_codon:yes gene_type:complete